jgi:plasmid stabilization system protein ParE
MMPKVVFHRLVQRDMSGVMTYYTEEAAVSVGDRFFRSFLEVVDMALHRPKSFHTISPVLRRANVPGFPYHFLYRETADGIRVLVLRHDRRHPSYGLNRRK